MLQLILVLVIVAPIAWLASEFQRRRWLRIVLGCAAILLSFGVAWIVGSLERLNSNAWYGAATKDLVQNTIEQLEAGNTDRVLAELRRLRSKYYPSYETRSNYDELGSQYVERISDEPVIHDPGRATWDGR